MNPEIDDAVEVGMAGRGQGVEDHDVCCIDCVIDSDRAEAFFAIILTTKKLLSEFYSSKPLETDETYKVMHEGYGLTLIGQSDSSRVWHVRYIISHPAFK